MNGINTSRLRHEDIINLLKNVGDVLNLGIEYELPPANQANQHQVQKIVQVSYSPSDSEHSGGLGFVLRGGNVPTDSLKSRPLVVSFIRPDSRADKEQSENSFRFHYAHTLICKVEILARLFSG